MQPDSRDNNEQSSGDDQDHRTRLDHLGVVIAETVSVLSAISVVSLFGVVGLLIAGILFRNLDIQTVGLGEIAQILTIWSVFLVLAEEALRDRHFRVDYFIRRFPENTKGRIEHALRFLNVFTIAFVLLSAVIVSKEFWTATTPANQLPVPLLYAAAVVGMTALLAVYGFQLLAGEDSRTSADRWLE